MLWGGRNEVATFKKLLQQAIGSRIILFGFAIAAGK